MLNKNIFIEDGKNWHAKSYFSLLKTSGWIDVKLKQALKPFGITHAQLNILNLLAKSHPEPMDAKSLKEKLIVQSPDLTRLLDRLVKKGLVNRKTCPENRRKLDITITDNGIKLFYEMHTIAKKSVNNFFEENITEEEAKLLFRILSKIK